MTARMRCFIPTGHADVEGAGTTLRKGVAREFRSLIGGREYRRVSCGGATHPGSRTMKSSGLEPADRLTSTSRLSQICLYSVSNGVPQRSLVVALIVGSILILINQTSFSERGASI